MHNQHYSEPVVRERTERIWGRGSRICHFIVQQFLFHLQLKCFFPNFGFHLPWHPHIHTEFGSVNYSDNLELKMYMNEKWAENHGSSEATATDDGIQSAAFTTWRFTWKRMENQPPQPTSTSLLKTVQWWQNLRSHTEFIVCWPTLVFVFRVSEYWDGVIIKLNCE